MSSSPSARASATPPRRTATEEERQRVLDAFEAGGDWLMVARYNNVSRAAAYRLCKKGDPSPPPRGGARASCVKCTDAMVEALETYLDEECTLTLVQLRDKLMEDFEVDVSTSTISAKLATKLITLKQRLQGESEGVSVGAPTADVLAGFAPSMTEARMCLLEDAANSSIGCMNRHLVVSMALHCQRAVADALKMEDMQYGA
ncbi:hypothetical protein PF002_g10227 [Phytophthora fragariae]|uniref:Uncharacterized protein n=1 Tax=Phytophthora fragariae TaxID=53985 RepID=A0A6A3ZQC9_9STRA|nr:hypothetical protein PF003_g33631 [Phytophthora fragariae]KAE9239525.1 hypothetical protein PF002_g10227 [Phytophthora fragariae]